MRGFLFLGLICAWAGMTGCGNPAKPSSDQKPVNAAPAIPEEIASAGRTALGNEAEVLAYGDLALIGRQQVLVINRLIQPASEQSPAIVFTRLAVLENDDGKWKEVLLCDEHLKNSSGFLGGTPNAAITAWRLQFEKNPQRGLSLFFIPYQQGAGVRSQTIEVRWNPEVKRYQAMDASYTNFIGEAPAIEEIHRPLK
ncbi:MAG TPA: hypothetical protein VN774_01500 [Candidatus Limnocylindrales bacterium]|nr:hypothetical protein [Candidatus Limnocylindrales bacterium]